jgi:hypothetical protein
MKASIKFSIARGVLTAALGWALCAPASHAVPFTYDEAITGDLSGFPPPSVFAFDVGTNTVSGTIATSGSDLPTDITDFDPFAFSIPADAPLTGISYAFTTTTSGPTDAPADFFLFEGNLFPFGPVLGLQTVDLVGASPVTLFSDALPLGAGVYLFSDLAHTVNADASWLADYQITFNVTSVPEPGTLALLGIGALGALIYGRRRLSSK